MQEIDNIKNLFNKIISFLFDYWKDIVLTLFLIFAFFILLNPYKAVYITSWILFIVCIPMLVFLWDKTIKEKARLVELKNRKKNNEGVPIFLGDDEINEAECDKLNIVEDAKSFANQVLNNGSKNPIIFGLDSPWGSGKTSYINLCENLVWKEHKDEIIVFRFRPMLFDADKQNLASFFIDELIKTLKKENLYLGELDSDLKKLMKVVKGISIWGIGLTFSDTSDSTGKLLENIKNHSKLLEKKIIVIVDDLDRLYLEDIKAILGVIRNVFYTENMTFILCYDSNSINTFETKHKVVQTKTFEENAEGMAKDPLRVGQFKMSREYLDNRMVNAYLEKFVQVKKSLIPGREQLMQLLKELAVGSQDKMEDNLHLNKLLNGIEVLFAPESFWRYQPLIGDVRKIKRIANFLQATGSDENIVGIDYAERDIEPIHLLRLVLIYINFPAIFQRIYFSETGGARGFFSAVHKFSAEIGNNEDKYTNSEQFFAYLRTLSDEESFLLHELFCVKCAEGKCKRNEWSDEPYPKRLLDDEEFLRTSPMFNGHLGTNKNLGDYLTIIHDHRLRPKSEYYAFHKNRIQELSDKTVEEIFSETNEYNVIYGERPRESFFVASQTKEIPFLSANKIISYIVKNLQHYSMLDGFSSIYNGLRGDLIYRLIWILEMRGWTDEDGKSFGNSDENIAILAKRILENDPDLSTSISDSLLDVTHNPILSLADFTKFIYAYTDSQSTFNLKRSLEIYSKANSMDVREMLSRKAFLFFRNNFIDKGVNFIQEINDMPDSLLLGDFSASISEIFKKEKRSLDNEINKTKTNIIGGLIYRFSSEENQSLALYTSDADSKIKICDIARDYLFDICFNIKLNIKNSELFINYILAAFDHYMGHRGGEWKPNADSLYKTLCEERLKKYWTENHEQIKTHIRSLSGDTKVFTSNYSASYKDDLESTFSELDKKLLVQKRNSKSFSIQLWPNR